MSNSNLVLHTLGAICIGIGLGNVWIAVGIWLIVGGFTIHLNNVAFEVLKGFKHLINRKGQ